MIFKQKRYDNDAFELSHNSKNVPDCFSKVKKL